MENFKNTPTPPYKKSLRNFFSVILYSVRTAQTVRTVKARFSKSLVYIYIIFYNIYIIIYWRLFFVRSCPNESEHLLVRTDVCPKQVLNRF